MNILDNILQNIPILITLVGVFVVGIVAIVGIFDRKFKDKKGEEDALDEKIKKLYKEESDAQAKKINELTTEVASLRRAMDELIKENKIIKDIFQGRDAQSVEFQKQGFEAIKRSIEIQSLLVEQKQISIENNKEIKQTNRNIERLAMAIENRLQKIEKNGGEESCHK